MIFHDINLFWPLIRTCHIRSSLSPTPYIKDHGKTNQGRRGTGRIPPALSGICRRACGRGMLTLQACRDEDDTVVPVDNGVNIGSGDIGILNYAYALKQLEPAFYTQVIASQYSGITSAETALLTDIRDHKVAHRNFFKAAIAAAGATPIQDLEVDFSTIDFSSRDSVLGAAKTFEDLG